MGPKIRHKLLVKSLSDNLSEGVDRTGIMNNRRRTARTNNQDYQEVNAHEDPGDKFAEIAAENDREIEEEKEREEEEKEKDEVVVSTSTTSNKGGHPKGSRKSNNDDDYTASDNEDEEDEYDNNDDDDDDDDEDIDYRPTSKKARKGTSQTKKKSSQTKKKYRTKKSINEKVKNTLLPWETSTKLNRLGLDVSLRIAVEVGTRINQKVTYPTAAAAHKRHCFKPTDLVTSSSYNELEKEIEAFIGGLGYDPYVIRSSYIYYDTYKTLPSDFVGSICVQKSNDSLLPISDTHEFQQALINTGLVLNNNNIAGNTTDIDDDDDDNNLNVTPRTVTDSYHLDIVVMVKEQNKTKKKDNTTVSFTKYKFRVMNVVVRELKPRPNKKNRDDDDDDDASSDDSTDDDNDDDDDEYGLEKDYISNNKTPVDDFIMTPDEFNVDHVYDTVRGLCYNVYRKHKKHKSVGLKSAIFKRNDRRSMQATRLDSSVHLSDYIEQCKSKRRCNAGDGVLEIDISLGKKLKDDTRPNKDTLFQSTQESTDRIINPPATIPTTGGARSSKVDDKLNDQIHELFLAYYKHDPKYKGKICLEHRMCMERCYGNKRAVVAKLLKDANNNKFTTLSWMASYSILDKMGVAPPGEQEYEWDCVGDPPTGKNAVISPQQQVANTVGELTTAVTTMVNKRGTTDNEASTPKIGKSIVFTRDYGQHNELLLTLTPSQVEQYVDGKAILKYCCDKEENNDAQGVFWFDRNVKAQFKAKTHDIQFEFLETGMKLLLKQFKKTPLQDLLMGSSVIVKIKLSVVEAAPVVSTDRECFMLDDSD